MGKGQPLVASVNSLDGTDDSAVVFSVVSYVNVVLAEGGDESDLHTDALGLYAVDHFHGQVLNGGFSQFVYNSGWNDAMNHDIAETLLKIGAHEYLAYFTQRREFVNSPDVAAGLDEFFRSDYFGENAFRDSLNDDAYFEISADLGALMAQWVRSHPDLQPHTIDEMFERAEAIVGHPIEREH